MRRLLRLRLLHAGAWTLATGAAVTVSWFGVHTVLSGTAYDPPRALPVEDVPTHEADPQSSSTHRPKPTPSPTAETKPPPPPPTKSPSKTAKPTPTRPSPTPTRRPSRPAETPATGTVRGVTVPGGRAVFDMGEDAATLVSATPESGWGMSVWSAPQWIRVTFSDGGTSSTVFCRWDDSPSPRIETFAG